MKLENAINLEEPSLGMMMGLIHAKTSLHLLMESHEIFKICT
jgi:hypothetical protein